MKIYLVGGAVRDQLLGTHSKDKDYVVVGSTPDDLIKEGYIPVGKSFPVFLHPITKEEYALARKEVKTGKGHKSFDFEFPPTITLEEDLIRRDLTINAMAFDIEKNKIIDPFKGQEDLENKILRHVSKHFEEDPLRVLRVARFKARFPEFTIHPSTLKLMEKISISGELNYLSGERILDEMVKSFHTNRPDLFFRTLKEVKALEVLFPEIYNLVNVPAGPLKYHPEGDSFEHTMLVLLNARKISSKPEILFTSLVHDLGKGLTPKDELPKHRAHEVTGIPLINEMSKRLKVPSSWKDFAITFTKNHLKIHQIFEMTPSKIYNLLVAIDSFRRPERFDDYLICSKADHMGKLNNNFPQEEFLLKIHQELLNYNYLDLLNKFSGKKLGEMINQGRIKLIAKIKAEIDPK